MSFDAPPKVASKRAFGSSGRQFSSRRRKECSTCASTCDRFTPEQPWKRVVASTWPVKRQKDCSALTGRRRASDARRRLRRCGPCGPGKCSCRTRPHGMRTSPWGRSPRGGPSPCRTSRDTIRLSPFFSAMPLARPSARTLGPLSRGSETSWRPRPTPPRASEHRFKLVLTHLQRFLRFSSLFSSYFCTFSLCSMLLSSYFRRWPALTTFWEPPLDSWPLLHLRGAHEGVCSRRLGPFLHQRRQPLALRFRLQTKLKSSVRSLREMHVVASKSLAKRQQGQAWNPKTTPQSALTTNVHRPRKLARPNLLEAPS